MSDERVMPEDIPLVIETTYHNGGDEPSVHVPLDAGCEPFILFRMRQDAETQVVVLDVTASLIENEDELIETLEVFFETMVAEREMRRHLALAAAEEALEDGGTCG